MNKLLYIFCAFFVIQSSACFSEELSLVVDETSNGILVYISNTTSVDVRIKNTLNLRGRGSSLSPVSLSVEDARGNKYEEVMIVDPADELTCLSLRPNTTHGIIYKAAYIKKMFNLDSGLYRVKATYEDSMCEKSVTKKIESKWIEVKVD